MPGRRTLTIGTVVTTLLAISAAAPLGWAANTTIQNGESLATARQKLNLALAQVHNVKQPPYSAHADNSHDDHDAIQAAINDACTDGAPVYIPSGTYRVLSTVSLAGCWGTKNIRIFGDGRNQTQLAGYIDGFVLDNPDTTGGCCKLVAIEHIGVANYFTDISAGAVRMANINPGSYIRDCTLSGYTALDISWNVFTADVSDCNFDSITDSGTPGTTAVYMWQVHFANSKIAGYDIGVAMQGPGNVLTNIGVETSNVGVFVGRDRPSVFRGRISGTTLTIDKWYGGHALNYWGDAAPYTLSYCTPCKAGTQITTQLTNTNPEGLPWKEGTYTLNHSQAVAAQSMMWDKGYMIASGSVINGLQTDRDNVALWISMANNVQINGAALIYRPGTMRVEAAAPLLF
jgi:hypothetical protein